MSTKHTANIYITNNSGGNAIITMSHQYSDTTADIGQWPAAPGETVGPLVVHYETGFGTGLDWWSVKLVVQDGPAPGVYTSGGSFIDPGQKECMMKSEDANQNITNTVDTSSFHINLRYGGCSAGMAKVGPYTKITNVFVLMLENHSFDHLLGFSGIKNSTTSINGLNGTETNSYTFPNGETVVYGVHKGSQDPMTTDPGHEFLDTLEQLCGQGMQNHNPFPPGPYPHINNSGFAANYATTTTEGPAPDPGHIGDIMACCDPATQVPALYTLAQEFAVCDTWHASIPGPTWPNRFFAMGGSSSGLDDSPTKKEMFEWLTFDGFTYSNGSIFDSLKKKGLSYRLYNDNTAEFSNGPHWFNGGEIPIVASLKHISVFDVHSFRNFADDLKGTYPYQYTFIEPNYGNIVSNNYESGSSQHPKDSLAAGDQMIAATYAAIRNSPQWETSLLIITYDEHGGFYDHVPPPKAPKPGDGINPKYNTCGFDFSQYGIRVPAVIVSPLIPKNTIDHTLYDHTSILKTLEDLYGLPALTKRDALANSLLPLLSLEKPRTDCPVSVPAAAAPAAPLKTMEDFAETQAMMEVTPLPETGNINGSLFVALKTELEISDGSEESKQAILAKFQTIQTRAQASDYINGVMAKVSIAKGTMEEK